MQQNQESDLLILFQHYFTDKIQRKDPMLLLLFFYWTTYVNTNKF